MKVDVREGYGVFALTPVMRDEDAVFRRFINTIPVGGKLRYINRGCPNGSDKECHLLYHTEWSETRIYGSSYEDIEWLRYLCGALHLNREGLTFLDFAVFRGRPRIYFEIAHCQVCRKPVLSLSECLWKFCDSCRQKCSHIYADACCLLCGYRPRE